MRAIKTYSLTERAMRPDFGIHHERGATRIEQAHRHEYFQVQLNLAGVTQQTIGSTTRPLLPGSLSFVLPYRVHRVAHPPGSRFYVINFSQRFLRPELDIDPLDLEDVPLDRAPELGPFLFQEFMDFRLSGEALALARSTCEAMMLESAGRRFCSMELVRAHLLMLLCAVGQAHEPAILQLAAKQAQRTGRRNALARVSRFVRENLTKRLTLTSAAAAADLSPNYLAHLIKKETGKTFVDMVTERRMEKAQELLAHTSLRISEIAQAIGFEDEAYFSRRFRQRFHVAPRDYRARTVAAALR
ncbi:MAG: AraC family transcriptional regulator [Burkholderiales bacterium]